MSVGDRRSDTLTRRGELPSSQSDDVRPLESAVTEGRLEAPRERTAYEVGGIDVQQLALALAEATEKLKPTEPDLPFFGELAEAWFERIKAKRVAPGNEERLLRRLKALYLENEKTLSVAMVSELIEAQADYAASTRNKLRAVGRQIVEWAQASQKWLRPNPFGLLKREKQAKRKYELLTLKELYEVQLHLRADRLRMLRVALHLGLRPGELIALKVEDVDFHNCVVKVRRSWSRDETKTGTERDIPLHPAITTELIDACVEAKGELVFGDAFDGSMQSQNTKLTRILRTAMVKAGVGILGADFKCRRKGCGWFEYRPGAVDRRRNRDCPRCEFKLLPVPLVREVRWYDLRHMCATFHHDAGADSVCVKLAMGHSLEGTTEEIYTHPSMGKMAFELARWKLAKPQKSQRTPETMLNAR